MSKFIIILQLWTFQIHILLNHWIILAKSKPTLVAKKSYRHPPPKENKQQQCVSGQIIATGLLQIVVRRKGIPPKCPEFLNQKRAACWGPEAGHGSHLHFFGPGKTSRWCRRKWVGWVFPRTLWMEVSRDVCLQVGLGFVERYWNKLVSSGVNYKKLTLFGWGSVWSTDFFPELGVFEVHLQNWVPSRELCSLKRHRKFWWWFLLPKASKNK